MVTVEEGGLRARKMSDDAFNIGSGGSHSLSSNGHLIFGGMSERIICAFQLSKSKLMSLQ